MTYKYDAKRQQFAPNTKPGFGAALVSGCLALLAWPFVNAWWIMLLIGAAHHELSEKIPAVGYWGVFFAVLLVNAVMTVFRGVSLPKESK